MTRARKPRSFNRKVGPGRLDWAGAAFLAVAISAGLAATFAIAAPHSGESKPSTAAVRSVPAPAPLALDAKFKGHLPITELTEDQAILHALNRLGYGPRPGDVARIRQMGLEKWIDQQLHPESIDDSALDTRLKNYPTLDMSARKLLAEYPPPNQAAKQAGETKDEYKQEMMEKRRTAMAQLNATGDDNADKAQEQL